MRKFIISDIHGLGNIYYSIMNYLENINKVEEIELYINGDLFDRGIESAEILIDVINKIKENKFKIVYLGGNHELLMHEVFYKREKGLYVPYENDWYLNGGSITDYSLYDLLNDKEKVLNIADFISNLDIYHKFEEKINGKPILLVHAAAPSIVKDNCDLKIKSEHNVLHSVWTREFNPFIPFNCTVGHDDYITSIGHDDYFTIIGHTPNNNIYGIEYHNDANYLNIDGGCSKYAHGFFEYDHTPLVEVKDGYLKILTFNNSNDIIYGNYFDGTNIVSFTSSELLKEKEFLNKELNVKKLIKLPDGVIGYEEWL